MSVDGSGNGDAISRFSSPWTGHSLDCGVGTQKLRLRLLDF
jgi:hypothetical protein